MTAPLTDNQLRHLRSLIERERTHADDVTSEDLEEARRALAYAADAATAATATAAAAYAYAAAAAATATAVYSAYAAAAAAAAEADADADVIRDAITLETVCLALGLDPDEVL